MIDREGGANAGLAWAAGRLTRVIDGNALDHVLETPGRRHLHQRGRTAVRGAMFRTAAGAARVLAIIEQSDQFAQAVSV